MRRHLLAQALLGTMLFFGCAATTVWAQNREAQEEAPHDTLGPWKITNSVLFAALLGFALFKYGPPFFNARTGDIQKAIKDATGLKLDADYRYSEADRKMATLGEEVKKIRAEGATALEAMHGRMQKETEQAIERIRKNVSIESEALRLEGIRHLRLRTTNAAFAQVEARLREQASSGQASDLLPDFIHLVERGQN